MSDRRNTPLKVTQINFKHPLLKDVFKKSVTNFQYPSVQHYYPTTFQNASPIVSFENNADFISQVRLKQSNLFWVASPLQKSSSNFTNSPLIVPIFYNIGKQSFKMTNTSYRINHMNRISVAIQLGKDAILNLKGSDQSFIPLQRTQQNKVTLTTEDAPTKQGFYDIMYKTDTLKTLAYNYPLAESNVDYMQTNPYNQYPENVISVDSVKDIISEIHKKNEVQWLWKLFLSIAIVSLFLEILILKYVKV